MITKPNELNFSEKKIAMIVAGVPGVGKTTLALSAPKPLLIDLDKGISRVDVVYRKDSDQVNSYEEMVGDLNGDLSKYETIIIDTGGKLLEFLKPVVIKENAKNGQTDGTLTLKGYGAVKRKFNDCISNIKRLGKNVVVIFHATEVNLANDIVGLRIRIEGSSKDEVWDDMDIGGFIEMRGNKRVISFQNCDRFYAKKTHGIKDTYEIPLLKDGSKNTFLTDLFNLVNENLNEETLLFDKYTKAMSIKIFIEKCSNVEDLNKLYEKVKTTEHALTSKDELWFALNNKSKELSVSYDKTSDSFK